MNIRLIKAGAWVAFFAACALGVSAADDARARSPLEGTWLWSFTNADGGVVTPRLKFKSKDGELTGVSRFRLGTEAPVTNLTFRDNQVAFDIVRDYLGEPVTTHYQGKLSGTGIKGTITSKSGDERHDYVWEAKRISGVEGVWKWTVSFGRGSFEARATLKAEGEKLTGKTTGRRGDVDIHRGRFKDNHVYFEVESRGMDNEKSTNVYKGKLDGDKITGTFTSSFRERRTNDWNAVRAD